MYVKPTTKILDKVDQGGIPQPAPRNPKSAKLGDILEGIRFYGIQLTEDSKKISLDAAYNIVAYGNQLISKLDEMKDFNMDYVQTCIQIIEHGNLLYGIDVPTSIPDNWPTVPPHAIELQGTPYRLTPGNAKISYPDEERTIWTKECLICGRDHFTNEHESRVVFIKKDLQKDSLENRLNPRRTSLFTRPGEPVRPRFYSDVYYTTENREQIIGSRPRREGTIPHTTTTSAMITEEGRVIPFQTIPQCCSRRIHNV
ncbi:hypothetical protein M378DRAFT_13626 [Amanita muscaria Koide BX008]|uniref:Uncharacterized protein n=1 Tax=Amanita muscaria (strain Koide BX008) TaxID=946122 RepID=A0A0C2WXQ7_AMAMK|nr:hypothetical protein M378DRAFT_13626 [Amanita muscaria Koide BX008]